MLALLPVQEVLSGTVFVADGSTIVVLDSDTLTETNSFDVGATINGLGIDRAGGDLYATAGTTIYRFTRTGSLVTSFTWSSDTISYHQIAVQGDLIYAVIKGVQTGATIRNKDSLSSQEVFFDSSSAVVEGIAVDGDGVIYITSGSGIFKHTALFGSQSNAFNFEGVSYLENAYNNGRIYTMFKQGTSYGVTIRDSNLTQADLFSIDYIPSDISDAPGNTMYIVSGTRVTQYDETGAVLKESPWLTNSEGGNRSLTAVAYTEADTGPKQWQFFDGGNEHFYELRTDMKSWSDAASTAATLTYNGLTGHLVTIGSAEENQFLMDNILGGSGAHIGLTDAETEGSFYWLNGDVKAYTNWNEGEPNDAGGEDATMLLAGSGLWNDINVGLSSVWIVEYEAVGPKEWQTNASGNGHYYRLVEESATWEEAEVLATTARHEGFTGHLVTINSQEEQNFLLNNVIDDDWVWIGFDDRQVEDDFRLVTGETITFTNWGENEPNNSAGIEHVTIMETDGSWNDGPLFWTMEYVVEFGSPGLSDSADSDGDGLSNRDDDDDDNDGMPDKYEQGNGLDVLVADADGDLDNDGASNLKESLRGSESDNAADFDACDSTLVTGSASSDSNLAEETQVYFANPGSNTNQQTFLRIINPNDAVTNVQIYAIDDQGNTSRKGSVEFTLQAQAALQLTAQDLENGNTEKGVTGNLCDGEGKWRLRIRSNNSIVAMSLIRTPDGFLTSQDEIVSRPGDLHTAVDYINPASNTDQQTFIRVMNPSSFNLALNLVAYDDTGAQRPITVSLASGESLQLTSADLENGNPDKGFSSGIGAGSGKWRVEIQSDPETDVPAQSMIRTPDGFLTNLSGVAEATDDDRHGIYFANPASETNQQSFLRIVNASSQTGTFVISGFDANGFAAPGGTATFTLNPFASKQLTTQDIENGNTEKGLVGALGNGTGRWQLYVSSDLALEDTRVMSLVRTSDGFLTNLSRPAPESGGATHIYMFNPASNTEQRSSLYLVNLGANTNQLSVQAWDDAGNEKTFNSQIGTLSSVEFTAAEIEQAIGTGVGKWRFRITGTQQFKAFSLLNTSTGFLTNLSSVAE